MHKRTRLLLMTIAAVLVGATLLFLTVNNSFISPYYIHQKRTALRTVCSSLAQTVTPLPIAIAMAEKNNGVIVAAVPNTTDINLLNERLRASFLSKGLGLSNYWLWEEDYKSTVQNGTQQRVYGQEKLGYSVLVQYMLTEDLILAVATVIPYLSRPLTIVNTVSAVIMGATALLLMGLVWWMSSRLEQAQHKVALKNEQMKQLLNNVSHDLKTPIALIKAYTAGLQAGMDDGSFLETIVEQNDRMERLTLRLLELSRWEDAKQPIRLVNVRDLLSAELARQHPLFAAQSLQVESTVSLHPLAQFKQLNPMGQARQSAGMEQSLESTASEQAEASAFLLQSNAELLTTIFDNLLSNARKYATAAPVRVSLHKKGAQLLLEVKNPTDLPADTDMQRLWEPFNVAEGSRNSTLSGSGLGLSLVRAAATAIGASAECQLVDGEFCVVVVLG